jgi:hypothetical protein
MSSYLESSKKLRSINVRMTPCGEKWIMSFGYFVLKSRQRPPRQSGLKREFDYETRDAATYLIVNETKIRQADAFREVGLFDYHPPRTSKKRTSQRRE